MKSLTHSKQEEVLQPGGSHVCRANLLWPHWSGGSQMKPQELGRDMFQPTTEVNTSSPEDTGTKRAQTPSEPYTSFQTNTSEDFDPPPLLSDPEIHTKVRWSTDRRAGESGTLRLWVSLTHDKLQQPCSLPSQLAAELWKVYDLCATHLFYKDDRNNKYYKTWWPCKRWQR